MEPEISPLAKRLAEENNVNWRGLNGSGADGRILERDVLEYLARVMAGDEALDPTPEPVPEGMEAWPEEDTQDYLADSSSASAPSPEWSDPASTQTQSPDVELDDMIFDAPGSVSDEPVEISASASGDTADIDDDMFLFGEDDEAADHEAADDEVAMADTPEVPSMNVNANELMGDVNAEAQTLRADAADALGAETLDAAVSAEALNPDVDITGIDDLDDLEFDEDVASLFVDDVEDEAQDGLSLDASEPAATQAPNFSLDSDFQIDKPSADADLLDHVIPPVEAPPVTPDIPAAGIAGMGAAAAGTATGAFGTPRDVEPESIRADARIDAEAVTPAEHIAEVVSEPQPSDVAVDPVNAETHDAPAVTGAAQFVSYGTLLRRHVDMSALVQAQTDVAKELGQDESTVLSTLVLRACAKALETAPLGRDGKLGVADLSASAVSLAGIDNVASQGFAALVSDVQNAAASSADALALVVVDMSTSGVDEAVLNIDVPVLTIGRSLFDSTEGTHRSTISLSGDVGVESGSKFIAAVADLLDTPIRLVL